jgi:hypothetical protein
MGADVGSVLKEVGLTEDEGVGEERVWLHCIVGARLDEKKSDEVEEDEVCPIIIQRRRRRLMVAECSKTERIRCVARYWVLG